ncbi:hypothetical protein ACMGD3_11485 [Lysinibacillus sphaericus]
MNKRPTPEYRAYVVKLVVEEYAHYPLKGLSIDGLQFGGRR